MRSPGRVHSERGKGPGSGLEEGQRLVEEGDPAEKPEEETKELGDKPGEDSVQGVKEASVLRM